MLDKSSTQPKQRLLNLFLLLEDWLSAPFGFTESQQAQAIQPAPSDRITLQTYLAQQARLAGSKNPEILAHQLYFMAMSAGNTYALHPESQSLSHARTAAAALIEAELNARPFWKRPKAWGYSALALASTASIVFGIYISMVSITEHPPSTASALPTPLQAFDTQTHEASPAETAAIYARLEMMRHGDCRFIEALQLPEQVKSIYIENVIQGRISNNRQEQRIVQELLDQVKCNYTPKLMLNSVS